MPDAINGLQRAQNFYKGREKEPHVREVFQRLGDIYFDQTKYEEAIAVYKALLKKWPYYSDAPRVQDRIVHAYEKDRNLVQAAKERETARALLHQGERLVPAQPGQPGGARGRAPARRGRAADRGDQRPRGRAGLQDEVARRTRRTPRSSRSARSCYATSAELYEKYLAAYPNSKRSYEFAAFYADALYYSGQLEQAIAAYKNVRDSQLDNKYQEDAAFRMIKAYEEIIEDMKKAKRDRRPADPRREEHQAARGAADDARHLQEATSRRSTGTSSTSRTTASPTSSTRPRSSRCATATGRTRAQRLGQIAETSTAAPSPDVGFKAYDAILQTYFIDFNVQDEEQKDCALGELLTVAEQFSESAVRQGARGEAVPRPHRPDQVVGEDDDHHQASPAVDGERGEGDAQAAGDVSDGSGRHRDRHRRWRTPARRASRRRRRKARRRLDRAGRRPGAGPHRRRQREPQDPGAPTALNNACVIYEKLFQFGEATKCYERLYGSYPDSEWGKEALWNASRNHYRFFEFDQAVKGYLTVAQDPKFAQSEHRKEALGLAASLLDNDQQYARAADLYKKYSDAISDKPQDSAQAYFFACNAYEKANDIAQVQRLPQGLHQEVRQAAGGG